MLSLTSGFVIHHRFLPQRNPKFHRCNRRNPNLFLIQSFSNFQEIKKSSVSEENGDVETENFNSIPFLSIKAAKRVVLVRHGQSTWNEEGRIQGSSNFSVLTHKGEAQAQTSRQMLIDDTFDVCFTSPLNRSKRTAEIIWGTRKEAMIPDSDLREIDLYSFQGLLKHEGKAKFGEAFIQWQTDAQNFNIDGHYPVRELWARARNCWNEILNHEGKSVLVVAHNAVNQALVATAMGLGTKYFRVLLQSNCGVSVLDFTPQAQGESPHICLNRLNQTPNSPIAVTSSAGRKSSKRIILACYGPSQGNIEATSSSLSNGPMNMLGIIQSQKTAEFLLDLKVNSIICSPHIPSIDTAMAISKPLDTRSMTADLLDLRVRYPDLKKAYDMQEKRMGDRINCLKKERNRLRIDRDMLSKDLKDAHAELALQRKNRSVEYRNSRIGYLEKELRGRNQDLQIRSYELRLALEERQKFYDMAWDAHIYIIAVERLLKGEDRGHIVWPNRPFRISLQGIEK